MGSNITRRDFVKTGAAATAAMTASLGANADGANDRVRLAFIGIGNRGSQLIEAALPNEDMEIAALCDVYQPYLDKWSERLDNKPATFTDFRRIFDRNDIDAVVIATPDHWHAVQTIMACDAGLDVYVEKPLSITIKEGRHMVDAARRNNRVVQVGTHRRSSTLYAGLVEMVQSGGIGKVTVASAYRLSNMWPDGMGKAPNSSPPPGLDWDMWLGPRAERPFNENIAPYKFRWWQAYSSQLGNWGVHYFDLLRWILGESAPASVSTHGGQFAVNDDRTIPDTLQSIFEFDSGALLLFGQYEASGNPVFRSGEIELRGTKGTVYSSERGYEIIPERGGQFQDSAPRMEKTRVEAESRNNTERHMRNFLDCVKSRKRPNADVEDGHLSTVFCHLGNIALATQARIAWDAKHERVIDNDAANELLHYEYRAPWTLG